MPANVLSAAAIVAVMSNGVAAFTAPLRTPSPGARRTGHRSPVSADSSRTAVSFDTMPSVGTASPLRTRSRSPGSIAVIGLMLASGRSLEDFAEARARREMSALLSRVPRTANRYDRGSNLVRIPLDRT